MMRKKARRDRTQTPAWDHLGERKEGQGEHVLDLVEQERSAAASKQSGVKAVIFVPQDMSQQAGHAIEGEWGGDVQGEEMYKPNL